MQVTDVDDNNSDEYLKRDARHQHCQHKVVEPMTVTPDVEQQLELSDLCQAEDCHQSSLGLRLRLLQLTVTGQ